MSSRGNRDEFGQTLNDAEDESVEDGQSLGVHFRNNVFQKHVGDMFHEFVSEEFESEVKLHGYSTHYAVDDMEENYPTRSLLFLFRKFSIAVDSMK